MYNPDNYPEHIEAGVRAMIGKNAVIEDWYEEIKAVLAAVGPLIYREGRGDAHLLDYTKAYDAGRRDALIDAAAALRHERESLDENDPDHKASIFRKKVAESWLRMRALTEEPHRKVSHFGEDSCACGFDGWPCERDSGIIDS